MERPAIDILANDICIVHINGCQFYIEVSNMTNNEPFVTFLGKDTNESVHICGARRNAFDVRREENAAQRTGE